MSNPYPQQDHAFIRQAQAILAFDASARLGNIKADTCILTGKDDILVPPRNSEKLNKLIADSKLQVLEGAHLGCIEYPNEYNATILEFLGVAVPA